MTDNGKPPQVAPRGRGRPRKVPREAEYRMIRRDFFQGPHALAARRVGNGIAWLVYQAMILEADDYGRGLLSDERIANRLYCFFHKETIEENSDKSVVDNSEEECGEDDPTVQIRARGASGLVTVLTADLYAVLFTVLAVGRARRWLRKRRLIFTYQVGNQWVYQVCKWWEHPQVSDPKESSWPDPPIGKFADFLENKR